MDQFNENEAKVDLMAQPAKQVLFSDEHEKFIFFSLAEREQGDTEL